MSVVRLLSLVVIGGVAALLLRVFVFESIYIATGSMEPTLLVNTHVFLDKLTYRVRSPRRGDIISFRSPVQNEDMVKRVIAVPGDTVELQRKTVYVNGTFVEEPYVKHTRKDEKLIGDTLGPLKVPPNSVFVLGDNRDESSDSSVWKDAGTGEPVHFVPYDRIQGLVRGFY